MRCVMVFIGGEQHFVNVVVVVFRQCCGAGAGGAEIIWGHGVGAESYI